MAQVNMLEAKTKLSKLVDAIETGRESEIVLARNGKPVARIVPLEPPTADASRRLGIAEGLFGPLDEKWVEEFEATGKEISKRFYARRLNPTYVSAKQAAEPPRRRKKA